MTIEQAKEIVFTIHTTPPSDEQWEELFKAERVLREHGLLGRWDTYNE